MLVAPSLPMPLAWRSAVWCVAQDLVSNALVPGNSAHPSYDAEPQALLVASSGCRWHIFCFNIVVSQGFGCVGVAQRRAALGKVGFALGQRWFAFCRSGGTSCADFRANVMSHDASAVYSWIDSIACRRQGGRPRLIYPSIASSYRRSKDDSVRVGGLLAERA
jgi:hypothetical protein